MSMGTGTDRRLDALEARLAQLAVPENVETQFGAYRDDPVGFCRTRRGASTPH